MAAQVERVAYRWWARHDGDLTEFVCPAHDRARLTVGQVQAALRWWFEDRRTGRITIAQFPNWPLWAIGVAWVVRRVADDGSVVADIASVAATGLWLFWGADELVRGVNPWRRLLGIGVIAWQVIGLLG